MGKITKVRQHRRMTRSGTCDVTEHQRDVPERMHGPAKYPEKGEEGSEEKSLDKKPESKKPDSDEPEDEG